MVDRAQNRQRSVGLALSIPQQHRHSHRQLGVLGGVLRFAQLGKQKLQEIIENRLRGLTDQGLQTNLRGGGLSRLSGLGISQLGLRHSAF